MIIFLNAEHSNITNKIGVTYIYRLATAIQMIDNADLMVTLWILDVTVNLADEVIISFEGRRVYIGIWELKGTLNINLVEPVN